MGGQDLFGFLNHEPHGDHLTGEGRENPVMPVDSTSRGSDPVLGSRIQEFPKNFPRDLLTHTSCARTQRKAGVSATMWVAGYMSGRCQARFRMYRWTPLGEGGDVCLEGRRRAGGRNPASLAGQRFGGLGEGPEAQGMFEGCVAQAVWVQIPPLAPKIAFWVQKIERLQTVGR